MPLTPEQLYEFCDELIEDREGTPFRSDGSREYTRKWLVIVKLKGMTAVSVCRCPLLPKAYSPYITEDGTEYDLRALLVDLHARQDGGDWQRWIVTGKYSTQMPAGGPITSAAHGDPSSTDDEEAANNPELEPPEIEWDFQEVNRAIARDLEGLCFVNSCGQPFTPAPTFEFAYPVLVMTRNELAFDVQKATSYAYAVNSDVFLGVSKGAAQCLPPRARKQWKGASGYWRVTYRIRFGIPLPDGTFLRWQPAFPDQGTSRIETDSSSPYFKKPVPIMRGLFPISEPVLLDGKGQEKAPDEDGKVRPVTHEFKVYRERPFVTLIVNGLS